MKSLWIDPREIFDAWDYNNRKEHDGHIRSLAESMKSNGYLIEYPIIAFEAANIESVNTNCDYIVACGHHRRKAAIQAKIDLVFCEVHDGSEEDWIEKMSLDNFQFDATKPGMGLAFTETERRAACYQLLLLPKYLQRTNTSLSDEWNVAESTIRNWRKKLESHICEGSDALRHAGFSVPQARIDRLKAIIESTERVNEEGQKVTVRQKQQELSEKERQKLWDTIYNDCIYKKRSDGKTFIERHGLDGFLIVRHALCEMFGIEINGLPGQVSTIRLKQVHSWVLTDDEELVKMCQKYEAERQHLENTNEKCKHLSDELEGIYKEQVSPTDDTRSRMYRQVEAEFNRVVEEQCGYDMNLWRWYFGFETIKESETYLNLLEQLKTDMLSGGNDGWVEEFKREVSAKARQRRLDLETRWRQARSELVAAIKQHAPEQGEFNVMTAMDKRYNLEIGTTHTKRIRSDDTYDTLAAEIRHFEQVTQDLIIGGDWVDKIPKPKPLIEALGVADATHKIVNIEITYKSENLNSFSDEDTISFGNHAWNNFRVSVIPAEILNALWELIPHDTDDATEDVEAEEVLTTS